MWRRAWDHVTPLFAFPPAIRKMIYTTNCGFRWIVITDSVPS
jgi:transposase-like protein